MVGPIEPLSHLRGGQRNSLCEGKGRGRLGVIYGLGLMCGTDVTALANARGNDRPPPMDPVIVIPTPGTTRAEVRLRRV